MENLRSEVRLQEVCDLPYFTEPSEFYDRRMMEGMRIRELRFYAGFMFGKKPEELTVEDLKLAFLNKFPLLVDVGGSGHQVTVKKYNGEWILSCDCGAWIFNRNGRRCKHTEQMEKILERG